MPIIAAVSTAVPPFRVSQAFAKAFARRSFAESLPQIDRYLPIFDHAAIDSRAVSAPPEWFERRHGLGEANDRYVEMATELGVEASRAALRQAALPATAIDHIIVVSTTGLASPSLDARFITLLGMSAHTRRTPIWGLGCAGGVGGLERAEEYVRAFPDRRVLVVTIELCSLTYQGDDRSKRNLVALSLFADGAAAAIVAGDRCEHSGPSIVATQSTLFPDSVSLMGWDVVDDGFRVVFGTGIPAVVREQYRGLVEGFLGEQGLGVEDIKHHIYHPGGSKVLAAYEQALALHSAALAHSRTVLRENGNMSSATILFVLERFLRGGVIRQGEYGLVCVFGPGFSAELMLVRG
ncbi:MAG: type III polyketide synthase BpsA [Herpetosiphon sp.]